MEPPILWLRCGDADNYNSFGTDLHAAAEYLQMLGVTGELVRHGRFGLSAPGFAGMNYISAFWGHDDAQPTGELTDEEIEELNRRNRPRRNCR